MKKPGTTIPLKLKCTFADNHKEDISDVTFSSTDYTITDGTVKLGEAGSKGTVTAIYTDFFGESREVIITLEASDGGPNHIFAVNNGSAGTNAWDKQCNTMLNAPMVIGKSYVVKATIKADNPGECALWPIWTTSPNQWDSSTDVQYLEGKRESSDFQEYTWEVVAQYTNDKIQFTFGKIGGMIYFDDVSCTEKGTDVEMVVNGNF